MFLAGIIGGGVVDNEIRLRRGKLMRFKEKFYVYRHPQTDWLVLSQGDLTGVLAS